MRNKRAFTLLEVLLVIAILVALGTALIYERHPRHASNTQTQVTNAPSLSPSNTLHNTTAGYSLTYPLGWYMYQDTNSTYLQAKAEVTPNSADGATNYTPHQVALQINVTPTTMTLDQVISAKTDQVNSTPVKTSMVIGGQPAINTIYPCDVDPGLGCDSPEWFIVYKGNLYDITADSDTPDYKNILSSFTFTK